jgi:outer membrane murein-binding lipoprotein Lpp
MTMMNHTQAMHGHVDQMETHHAKLGGGVTDLYAAIEQCAALMQTLTQIYNELQGTHAEMHHTVQASRQTAATAHEEAQTSSSSGAN